MSGRPLRFVLLLALGGLIAGSAPAQPLWPEITREMRPWTRWWWMGSSVTEPDLTAMLETYRSVGLGGVEITPIYGVVGREDAFIPYLTPAWMEKLTHTLAQAKRLGLGVDMALGTGWPFGGPWVTPEHASRYAAVETYTLDGGERLPEPIRFEPEPFVRAVGSQVYELYGFLKAEGEANEGTKARPPLRPGSRPITIDELVQPLSANANLQALALDQVRFPGPLPMQALMAYSEGGDVLDLTARVDSSGRLDWTAPPGRWTLYALFQGLHGKMVERAAPGGEGYAIDHFSRTALQSYLRRFDQAFAGHDLGTLRAFFNDSYEVDDARGQADWTPDLFAEFERRRGYDLRDHLPALFGRDDEERNRRVLTDYRETVSDLMLEAFTQPWRAWSHSRSALIRNQAHGSPANILDLYAASDIPETEGTEILRFKYASSAANTTGKPLVAAEAATWLNEHFVSSLADVRTAVDRYFLGGVNHIVYHGTNYSPPDAAWPGWLFYAAVHFHPSNPFWDDFAHLNTYVTRVQSFLQPGRPDNDLLLYFPAYDRWADRGPELLRHFDGREEAFEDTGFTQDALRLLEHGVAYDFVSDKALESVRFDDAALRTGEARYTAVLIPEVRYMPLSTLQTLFRLAEAGATVIVHGRLPEGAPGLADLERREQAFQEMIGRLAFRDLGGLREASVGKGRFVLGGDLRALLSRAGVRREPMADLGLQTIRREHDNGTAYFIRNDGEGAVNGWVPLQTPAVAAALFDPASGKTGMARLRSRPDGTVEVYLQIEPGATLLLKTCPASVSGEAWAYFEPDGPAAPLTGPWNLTFLKGGPEAPPATALSELGSWTEMGGEAGRSFSGTARYTIPFPRPAGDAQAWRLDLGRVHESARVLLNGIPLDTLIGPVFQTTISSGDLRDRNTLQVEVSNLMANRIAALDRRGTPWKTFYNVNMAARLSENRNDFGYFDASGWEPRPSGLLGPVTLTPLRRLDP